MSRNDTGTFFGAALRENEVPAFFCGFLHYQYKHTTSCSYSAHSYDSEDVTETLAVTVMYF